VLVLGFDTATAAVSVALQEGDRVAGQACAVDARHHAELLMPMIAKVMADAGVARGDLDAIAVGVGPGPYTGLRVGVVTARVLGSVFGIPVHGVCSLDVIAASVSASAFASVSASAPAPAPASAPAGAGREFLVATDARRKEVYWARYDAAGRRMDGPLVGRANSIPGAAELPVAGAGGQLYPEAFGQAIGPAYPDARTLCRIVADRIAPGSLAPGSLAPGSLLAPEPLYLRRPDAREPGPPKRVTPPNHPAGS
jgi:tRNA threonylcarbamoyladenosine biosynthesis protein TsaB